MNENQPFDSRLAHFAQKRSITKNDYLALCKEGIEIANVRPELKEGIAYHLFGIGAYLSDDHDPELEDIRDRLGILELPEHHVADSTAGVERAWQEVEELVAKQLEDISA